MTYWTTKEISVVKELYPDHGSLGVSKVLTNRTRHSIRDMARSLGIKAKGRAGAGNKLGYLKFRRTENGQFQKPHA